MGSNPIDSLQLKGSDTGARLRSHEEPHDQHPNAEGDRRLIISELTCHVPRLHLRLEIINREGSDLGLHSFPLHVDQATSLIEDHKFWDYNQILHCKISNCDFAIL